ncbi:uncharacterized protein [Dermacentor albipictus]|uniref:uncharacterized protein isoform X2 n=1 Tax=Dermacentor albipictus TaxID=60249 RepID=UPI0031FBD07D
MRGWTLLVVCLVLFQELSAFDEGEFQCWGTTTTIPSTWVCDGEGDCPLAVDQQAYQSFERPDESQKICTSPALIAERIPLEVTPEANSTLRATWQHPRGDSSVPLLLAGYYLTVQSSAVAFTLTLGAADRNAVLDTLAPWTSYRLILRPFYSVNGSLKEERKLGRAVNATVVTGATGVSRTTPDAGEFQCWGTSTTIPSTRLCDGTGDCPLVIDPHGSQEYERPDESQKICAPPPLIAEDVHMEATTEGNNTVRLAWQPPQEAPTVPIRLAGYYVTAHSTASTFSLTLGVENRTLVMSSLAPWTSYTLILRPFYTDEGSPEEHRKFGKAGSITVVTGFAGRSNIEESNFECPGSNITITSERLCDGDADCPAVKASKSPGSLQSADESEAICVPPVLAKQNLAVRVFPAGDTGLVKWTSAQDDANSTLQHAGYVLTLISSYETLTRDIDRHATATKLTALVPGREYRLFLRPFYTTQGKAQHWRRFARPGTVTFQSPQEDSCIDDSDFTCPGTSKVIAHIDVCDGYKECPQPPSESTSPDESSKICAPYDIRKRDIGLTYSNLTRRSITLSWQKQYGDSSVPLELAGYVVTVWSANEKIRHLLPPERTSIKFEKLPLQTIFRFFVRPFYTSDGRPLGERKYQRAKAMWHAAVFDEDEYLDDKPFQCVTVQKVIKSTDLCDTYQDCPSDMGSYDESSAFCAPRSLLVRNKQLYMEVFSTTAHSASVRWLAAAGDSEFPYLVAGYVLTLTSDDWTHRHVVASNETSAVLTGLAAWRTYTLILRPFFSADGNVRGTLKYGLAQVDTFTTKISVPSEPRGLTINEMKEGVAKLEWEKPKNPAGPISGYSVTWNCNGVNNTESTKDLNIVISGLTSELHGCTFRVGAFNTLPDETTLTGKEVELAVD